MPISCVSRAFALTAFSLAGASLAAPSPALAGCHGSACFRQVVTPPVYGTENHEVMVEPERHLARRIPAEYQAVEQTVTIRPARQVRRVIPAEYQTVDETVVVSPGGRRWQVTQDEDGRTVGCWVDVPAQYATRRRTVEVRSAETVFETIPAVLGTRQGVVMTKAAGIDVEVVPARYETMSRQVEVEPARVSWQPIGHSGTPGHCGGPFGACRE